jgi:hypothetical protein
MQEVYLFMSTIGLAFFGVLFALYSMIRVLVM